MRKNILSLAVTAGVAGLTAMSAQSAMHLNDKGTGETLIYPFYSSTNGNDTYVHVANTTDFVKVVKVRFLEALNSTEVLDFNLYLSPRDMWTAAITTLPAHNQNGGFAGGVGIRSADTSCTVPRLGGPNSAGFAGQAFDASGANVDVTDQDEDDTAVLREQPFVPFEMQRDAAEVFPGDATYAAETEDTDVNVRGVQGYIEIIEMGILDPDVDTGTVPGTPETTVNTSGDGYNYHAAAIHGSDGYPANCSAIVAAWGVPGGGTAWDSDPLEDLLPYAPEDAGGLYGLGQVINVEDGTLVSYDAVAIDDFGDPLLGVAHTQPGDTLPSLAQAQSDVDLFIGDTAVPFTFTNNPMDPVNALFMADKIQNDYVIDPAIKGLTDWVITMPTKKPHVFANRATLNFAAADPVRLAVQPFAELWNGEIACEPFDITYWNREEATPIAPVDPGTFSPRPPSTPPSADPLMCAEVNIVTFNDGVNTDSSALRGSEEITTGVPLIYSEGWAEISFNRADVSLPAAVEDTTPGANTPAAVPPRQIDDDGGQLLEGLPVVGFAAIKYNNSVVGQGGAILNYAGSFKHKVVTSYTP